MARAVTIRMDGHEKECAMYRRGTMDTLADIKRILAWGIASLIGSMGTIIILLLSRAT